MTLSASQISVAKDMIIVNGGLERVRKEAFAACLDILYRDLLARSENKQEKPQS